MSLKYILLSILIHTVLFLTAIYFYRLDRKNENRKENPIFFELIEETLKKEEKAETKEDAPNEEKPTAKNLDRKQTNEEKPPKDESREVQTKIPFSETPADKEPLRQKPAPPPIKTEKEKPRPIKKNIEKPVEESIKSPQQPETEKAKVVSAPSPIGKIIPVYPRNARRKGYEGKVVVEIEVSNIGSVVKSKIISSSGHKELDNAAIRAVNKAAFSPATENGVSIQGKLRIPITFKLK